MATVCIPLADGFEEIEAVTLIDVLRRADLAVLVAGLSEKRAVGAHALEIKCDCLVKEINADKIDALILPGGSKGTQNLSTHLGVQALIKEMDKRKKQIGAICAAPMALHAAGVLNHQFTCYPGVNKNITTGHFNSKDKVVSDGHVMTSQGPGTAMEFSLAIVKKLLGQNIYETQKKELLA